MAAVQGGFVPYSIARRGEGKGDFGADAGHVVRGRGGGDEIEEAVYGAHGGGVESCEVER